MSAAVRETQDGLCLVDPIDVRTPEEAATLQRLDEQLDERGKKGMYRLLRKVRRMPGEGNDQDQGPGRS